MKILYNSGKRAILFILLFVIGIYQLTAATFTITPQNVSCKGGNNGSITINITSAPSTFQYFLYDGFPVPGNLLAASGSTTAMTWVFNTNITARDYTIVIKESGITSGIDVTIGEPADPLTVTLGSQTDISCNGASDGKVTISAAGGTPGYTYSVDAGVFGASPIFLGLSPGAHIFYAKDINACLASINVTILEPAVLSGSISSQTNVLCNGASTGSVTVAGAGGTVPYTYNIDGGAFVASGIFSSLAAGAHPVQVKDANGCTANVAVTITQPPTPVSGSITSQTNVLCNGASTGSVTVAGAGGAGPYTYNIDAGVFGASGTFSALSAGAHPVQVKDANGCMANVAVTITQPATVVAGSITGQTNILCFGTSTGSVTVAGAGGTVPYSYNIDGGVFGAPGTFNGLAAGLHPVQVKDANGCTANIPVTIIQPTLLTGSISSQTNVLCNGTSTGSVTVDGAGGTIPYTYNIDGGAFGGSGTFSGLAAGAHPVQVKDANGCTANVAVTITQPALLSGSISSQTNILCNGASTGSVTVAGAGGTVPYTFNIDGGAFVASGTFSSLAAGAHPVQVKDANGCTANVAVTITQPATTVSGSITSQTNVLCNGASTGSVIVSGVGGVSPYTYNIDAGTFGASGTFSALSSGAHPVQVKDANGCTANVAVVITQPATAVTGSITGQTNVLCFGTSTGSVTIAGAGGTGAITYNIDGGAFSASGTFTGLAAGSHPVQVKDANGCIANIPVTITQPLSAVSVNITSQANLLCNGTSTGSVIAVGAGGTGALTYNIDGGVFGASGTFNGLAAGLHVVQVKDGNGCTANASATLIEPPAITISSQSSTNLTCNGTGFGSITVVGAGGTGTLQYTLNPGAVTNTTGVFNNLSANTYTVSVSDANSCPPAVTPNIIITEPAGIIATVDGSSVLNLACFGNSNGIINITVGGGTSPYIFSWTGPSGFTSPTEDISGLKAGNYDLVVSDANGCSKSFTALATIVEPSLLTSNAVATDIICNGQNNGKVTITASGGTAPYTYSRIPFPYQASNVFSPLTKSTYNFKTKDANGCISNNTATINEPLALKITNEIKIDDNICYGDSLGEIRILLVTGGVTPYEYSIDGGLNFFTNSIFQKLTAGSYQSVVRDANGCLKGGNLNNIGQPSKMLINNYGQLDVTDCFGNINGQIAIEIGGGTGEINYNLDGVENNTSGIFSTVGGGDHLLTMTDANLCSIDTTVNLSQPVEMVYTGLVVTPVTGCNGNTNGEINATASGGAGSYDYSLNGAPFQASGVFSGLTGGAYTLSVRDFNLCVKDTLINISEPEVVSILTATSTNINCAADNDGGITVMATGGTGPYTYVLNPGAIDSNNTGVFTLLGPGAYTVSITDNIGCGPVNTLPLTITEPPAIQQDSVISKGISCMGSTDAEIHIYASGGTSPLTFSTDDGTSYSVPSDFTSLSAGTYYLSAMDGNGCRLNMDTISFADPSPLIMVSESKLDIVNCSTDPVGEVNFVVSGGTGSIEYSLDLLNWQASGNFTGLSGGSYTVTARDQNLCSLSSSLFIINAPAEITADISTTPDLNAFNKGSITITNASGGTGTLVFSIDGPAGTFSAQTNYTGLDAGTYPVVVRDDNNCTFEQDAVVLSILPLDVTVTLTHSSCNGDNTGSITLVSTNGTPPEEYSIDDSTSWAGSGSFTDLAPGTYYIFVRDGQSRYFQDTVLITEPSIVNIFGNITPSSCSSFSGDGAIDVTVNGGTSPYTFLWAGGETSEDLVNLNAGSYSLAVTDSKNCFNETTFVLPAITNVVADAGPDTTLCFGESYILNGQGGSIMSWSPAEGLSNPNISNPVVNISADASYVLTVIGFNDCTDIDTINIFVRPGLGLSAGNDTTIIKDKELTLVASGGPFASYNWLPAETLTTPDQATTIAHPLINTSYIVNALTEFGCTESDTILVRIAERLIVYDVFSPNNGDDKNNYFDIENANLYPDILVEVYTRWGEKLFRSTGYSDDQRWDGTYKGKDVPIGTYYYVIVPYHGAEALTGPLTIVR
jgi:gliding motility-associated-like protein